MDLKSTMASERNQIHSYDILGGKKKKTELSGRRTAQWLAKITERRCDLKRVTQGNCGEIVIEWFCILIALMLIQLYAFVKTHRTDYHKE